MGRLGFGIAAGVAAMGDVLFVRASPGAGTATGWTAFFATYLGPAAAAALVAALGQGTLGAICGGGIAGVAIAFNLLAILSVGIFFLPLTIWVVASARHTAAGNERVRLVVLVAGVITFVVPFLVLVAVHP